MTIINLISQCYKVKGQSRFYNTPAQHHAQHYDISLINPVSYSVSDGITEYAYEIRTTADSEISQDSASMTVSLNVNQEGSLLSPGFASAFASATIDFSPSVPSMKVIFTVSDPGIGVYLVDFATGESLLPPGTDPIWQSPGEQSVIVTMLPTKRYQMTAKCETAAQYNFPMQYSIKIMVPPV